MARDMRVAGREGVAFGLAAGLHAVKEVADVERSRIAADLFDRAAGQELRRAEDELAAVARFNPAGFAFEAHGARAEWNPAGFAENQLNAVFIAASKLAVFRRVVFDRRRAIVDRPLAQVDAMRAPFEHTASLTLGPN